MSGDNLKDETTCTRLEIESAVRETLEDFHFRVPGFAEEVARNIFKNKNLSPALLEQSRVKSPKRLIERLPKLGVKDFFHEVVISTKGFREPPKAKRNE